jgi:flavodoxin I
MKKVMIIYWSGTGNTEEMAKAVAEGASNNQVEVSLLSVEQVTMGMVEQADAIGMGCPSMGAEVLEESVMEPFVASIQNLVKGKPMVLFGSYGWGNGEWMEDWVSRMKEYGATLLEEGLIISNGPDANGIAECKALGNTLGQG